MIQKVYIEKWMRDELKLSGNKLLAFALLYTNPGENITSTEIGEWFGWSKRNALHELDALQEMGYVRKETVEKWDKWQNRMVPFSYYHPVYIGDIRAKLAKGGKKDG